VWISELEGGGRGTGPLPIVRLPLRSCAYLKRTTFFVEVRSHSSLV
jgi:hypothetical protein